MPGQEPLVSVVVPVYNGGRYLAETLDSILGQRQGPLQIIAVDDGSTDDSADVIRGYHEDVEYVFQANIGPNAARNAGIGRARGRFLAFLDQDDLWLPDKLESQLAVLDGGAREPAVVFGHVVQFVSPELARDAASPAPQSEAMPGYIPSTMLAWRDSFLRVGLFDARLRMGELIDWTSRAQKCGVNTVMRPEVVVRRRLHATNIGRLESRSRIDYVRAVKATIDRKRGRGRTNEQD